MSRILSILISTLIMGGCGDTQPTSIKVESTSYGENWPLNVPAAILRCYPPSVLVVEVNDLQYALNGKAITAGFPRTEPIMKDPNIVSMADFVEKARKLCPSSN